MTRFFRFFLGLFMVCATPVHAQVTVFAAASLRGALDEVFDASEVNVIVSYGGSGLLARQIAQGAPADVILLANVAWMDWLEGKNLLEPGTAQTILSNRLVVIGPKGAGRLPDLNADTLLGRLEDERLAIGHMQAVPAGIYAREWMDKGDLSSTLGPMLVETENVRAALALVARKEAALGVVYQSDAMAERAVDVLHDIPADTHSPIAYRSAVVADHTSQEARTLNAFLISAEAQDIFAAHGFLPAEREK